MKAEIEWHMADKEVPVDSESWYIVTYMPRNKWPQRIAVGMYTNEFDGKEQPRHWVLNRFKQYDYIIAWAELPTPYSSKEFPIYDIPEYKA